MNKLLIIEDDPKFAAILSQHSSTTPAQLEYLARLQARYRVALPPDVLLGKARASEAIDAIIQRHGR